MNKIIETMFFNYDSLTLSTGIIVDTIRHL